MDKKTGKVWETSEELNITCRILSGAAVSFKRLAMVPDFLNGRELDLV